MGLRGKGGGGTRDVDGLEEGGGGKCLVLRALPGEGGGGGGL